MACRAEAVRSSVPNMYIVHHSTCLAEFLMLGNLQAYPKEAEDAEDAEDADDAGPGASLVETPEKSLFCARPCFLCQSLCFIVIPLIARWWREQQFQGSDAGAPSRNPC